MSQTHPSPLPASHDPQPEALRCSCCGLEMPDSNPERDEAVVIAFRGGFWSVFGDENHVEGVFCQHCLQTLLGPWLRVTEGTRDDGWRARPGVRLRQPGQTG